MIMRTVLYFQESYSDGTDGNNSCDVQWLQIPHILGLLKHPFLYISTVL